MFRLCKVFGCKPRDIDDLTFEDAILWLSLAKYDNYMEDKALKRLRAK